MRAFTLRTLCLLTVLTCSLGTKVKPQRLAKTAKISNHPVIIVICFDGLRYDFLNLAQATPYLRALKNSGVSVPYMEPTFPTFTFPNSQSIATGLHAESHGVVGNDYFDPEINKTLSGFADDEGYWNYHHDDVLPIWIWNEMAGEGRVSGCVMWPGSSHPYGSKNNLLPTYYYPVYDESVPFENLVDTIIDWITNDTKPANLVFVYYVEPDEYGHAFGPNSPESIGEIEVTDNRTGYLINKLVDLGIYDQINLIVLGDHGMEEVTPQRVIHLKNLIDLDALLDRFHEGTTLSHLTPKAGKEKELHRKLTDLGNKHNFTVWRREELGGQPFYFNSSRRIGDYVVLADPGYAFEQFNYYIGVYNNRWGLPANETGVYGHHGYSNAVESMWPLFVAHGPAFRKGVECPPMRTVDVVPLISKIVGIPEPPTNGSLSRVVEMIDPNFLSKL